jgi:hypothetical protein
MIVERFLGALGQIMEIARGLDGEHRSNSHVHQGETQHAVAAP